MVNRKPIDPLKMKQIGEYLAKITRESEKFYEELEATTIKEPIKKAEKG
jgi:hypothetical protein